MTISIDVICKECHEHCQFLVYGICDGLLAQYRCYHCNEPFLSAAEIDAAKVFNTSVRNILTDAQ